MTNTFSINLKAQPVEEIQARSLTGLEAFEFLKLKNLERVVAVKVNGEMRDLSSPIETEVELEPVYLDSEEGLEILRHSTSHVMAMAVKELFQGVKVTIGPAIENGFYYDFDYERPFREDDLPKIEEKMNEIIEADLPFFRKEMTSAEAFDLFKEQGEDYKVELINDLGAENVSLYTQGSFTDLCRGPHIPSTGMINAFHLTKVAGAYWRGDENRTMLSRIYGVAFADKKTLKSYIQKLKEVEKRDHRRLTKDLDLLSFHDEGGAGLAYWHPKGGQIRVLVEDYWRKRHYKGGYDIVFTPHIGRSQLWQTSGHLDFYRDGMYSPMDVDGQDYYIKPMNCPFHIMIYKSRLRSYRELPLRWAELGTVYRYERSGTLHGLMRVRGFTQDDAHVFCTPDQVEDEILRVLEFSLDLLSGFGFDDVKIDLSVRDPKKPEKYAGPDEMWQQAEMSLIKAIKAKDLYYEKMEGEAVFYGPKIDIKIKDALSREWQCTTIQFDFNLPERFDMNFIGEDGKGHRPYMIHRALLGSLERFFGILVEHYAGAFPTWLAPVQAMLLTVTDRNIPYAEELFNIMSNAELRVKADLRNEKLGLKVREAQLQKIPYMLIVGDKECEKQGVTPRLRSGQNLPFMTAKEFIDLISEECRHRR
ncbi:MAG: threonine--tRNA ligase [Desulfobacteraceae bacterium]|nr:MAG: threonine--tRNA ligase [Desulfobacteraceae bacterium]